MDQVPKTRQDVVADMVCAGAHAFAYFLVTPIIVVLLPFALLDILLHQLRNKK